jgi:hypothetical protein
MGTLCIARAHQPAAAGMGEGMGTPCFAHPTVNAIELDLF